MASRRPAPTRACTASSSAAPASTSRPETTCSPPSSATPAAWAATVAAFQRVTSAALAAPVPVLAAIDGVCIGGALEFAASCDLRIATDRARFGTPEVGIGLVANERRLALLLPSTSARPPRASCCSPARCATSTGCASATGFVNEVVAAGEFDGRAIAAWAARFDGRLAHRRRAHQGDAQRPLRRPARRRDGARGAGLHRALRRARRAGGARVLRRAPAVAGPPARATGLSCPRCPSRCP